jgi:hypothetical protein
MHKHYSNRFVLLQAISRFWIPCVRSIGLHTYTCKDFYGIWISKIVNMSIPNEDYSRNPSCLKRKQISVYRPVVPVYTQFLDRSISAFQSISRNSEGHVESVQPMSY